MNPPDFGATQAVANALNDLACNFTAASSGNAACTQDQFGAANFLGAGTQVQFCLQVPRTLAFALGDTLLTARLRDLVGNLGPVQQLVLRVGSGARATDIHPGANVDPVHPAADTHAEPHGNADARCTPRPPAAHHHRHGPSRSAPPSRDPNPVADEKRFRHADDASTDGNRHPVALANAQRHHPRAGGTCGLILRLDPV